MEIGRDKRRLSAILAADIVGYSRLMEADESGTIAQLKTHRKELIDPKVEEYSGRIVKTTGDGILIEFSSVIDAVQMAVDVQRAIKQRNASVPVDRRIVFRVGINQGDIVVDGDDILGDGVNVASRLEGIAEPGGICVSRRVHEDVAGKLDLQFEDLGEHSLKNIVRPVQAFSIDLTLTSSEITSGATHPLPDKPSIAVLPFENMSGDPEQEYFSDGIAEDIITDLSKISGLFVVARNSSFAYKSESKNVRHICREVGVRYLLEGSVRRSGDRVRITAQLIDGVSGGHLWAERYDRALGDIFATQDEVTSKIVSALQLTLNTGERLRVAQRVPVNLDAYDCYLRARGLFFRFTKIANADALSLFEQAFALDPSYGQAMVDAATCHLREMTQVWSERPEESLAKAKDLAERAIALDAALGMAHTIRGFVLLWQKKAHDDALRDLEKGIGLDPNNAWAHAFYAMTLSYAGRPHEGIREIEIAFRLDPQRQPIHALFHFFLGFSQTLNGSYTEALDSLKQSSVLIPDFLPPHLIQAVVCAKLGLTDEASVEVAKVKALSPIATLRWMERSLPFKNARDLAMMVEAARTAGLPE